MANKSMNMNVELIASMRSGYYIGKLNDQYFCINEIGGVLYDINPYEYWDEIGGDFGTEHQIAWLLEPANKTLLEICQALSDL